MNQSNIQSIRHLMSKSSRKGFALISTIVIMSLLLLIAMAMLSHSTTEVNSSRVDEAQQRAEANAKLALMIAIGEMQNELGSDQRVTAWSNILDKQPATEAIDGVSLPHQLGVWDAWTSYITDAPEGSSLNGISDTYERGRGKMFRRWMFSYEDDALVRDWKAVTEGKLKLDDTNSIKMLAQGTLGKSVSENSYVRAGKMKLGTDGTYAWWVGGDNLRAALDVQSENVNETPSSVLTKSLLRHSQTTANDPTGEDAFESFSSAYEDRQKVISAGQAELVANKREEVRGHFFDFVASSYSLPVDVRRGKVKNDLNLFFENDDIPAEFDAYTVPSSPISMHAPIRKIEGAVANKAETLKNPHTYLPSWRDMRDYYRLYRSAEGFGLEWDTVKGVPYTKRHMTIGDHRQIDYANYTRMPLIRRFTFVIGLRKVSASKGRQKLQVVVIPIIVLWNPYNVEMRFGANDFLVNMDFDWGQSLSFKWWDNGVEKTGGKWKKMEELFGKTGLILKKREGLKKVKFHNSRGDSGDIIMKPGEVSVFSIGGNNKKAADSEFAYRGYIRGDEGLSGVSLDIEKPRKTPYQNPEFALSFGLGKGQMADNFGYSESSLGVFIKHNGIDHKYESVFQGGKHVVGETKTERQYGINLYGICCGWLDKDNQRQHIIPEDPAEREPWPNVLDEIAPVAIINYIAKSGSRTESSAYDSPDYRSRNWLHAPLAHTFNGLGAANEVTRVNFPYTMQYDIIGGSNLALGQAISVDLNTQLGYAGAGDSIGTGVSHIVTQELPAAPITDISGFATMRLRPATLRSYDDSHAGIASLSGSADKDKAKGVRAKYSAHHGAAFGMGIGNGYAHPMLPADDFFYQFTGSEWKDVGSNKHNNQLNKDIWNDHWDQLLITNDALYDHWFCSAFVPETENGQITKPLKEVVESFIKNGEKLSNSRYELSMPKAVNVDKALEELDDEGYKKAAAFILINGGFNVNSTSVAAWKSVINGMKHRRVSYRKSQGDHDFIDAKEELVVSRFRWAPNQEEGVGAEDDEAAWTGIRKLTDKQVEKLAQEIVRQVKLRGPFLNMSEFVNRRLEDSSLGQASALQAAIDWDEFDNEYNGKGNSSDESINGRFKSSSDMITSPNANFPNDKAAKGSRYAGIAGYVMASDILQGIGSSLTPRDDTFTVRAYGEALNEKGEVIARAWCEAKIQRIIDYTESTDKPWEAHSDHLGKVIEDSDADGLSEQNRKFGRKFVVKSFRWLSEKDI